MDSQRILGYSIRFFSVPPLFHTKWVGQYVPSADWLVECFSVPRNALDDILETVFSVNQLTGTSTITRKINTFSNDTCLNVKHECFVFSTYRPNSNCWVGRNTHQICKCNRLFVSGLDSSQHHFLKKTFLDFVYKQDTVSVQIYAIKLCKEKRTSQIFDKLYNNIKQSEKHEMTYTFLQ